MNDPVEVAVLLNGAREGNTPLETVANSEDERVEINIVVWKEVNGKPYGLDVTDLGAKSRFDLDGYRKLWQYLSEKRPDILHVHPIAIGTIATGMARSLGIPVVTTEHNSHTHHGKIKKVVNGITNAFRSVVVSNSQATADSFSTWEQRLLQLADTNQIVIPYGPNIARIDTCRREGSAPKLPEGTIIGAGGRLSAQKNLATLIDAFSCIQSKYSSVHLVFTGEGPQRELLEEKVRSHGLTNNIHFLGWFPSQKDVFSFYDAIDIFAFPSHYEGFGMANAEAMAAETPVVCNDIPVLQEVVGDAGILVDATDENELADALERLIENPDLRSELGERARKRIEDTYSITRSAKEYADLYCDIAGRE
ncbi:glycosyltransferase [Halorhabdus amylolytica]|uniref:glycosyltransferase n=1 Tax=Halorhabdus amylolytica TaxID=2559573 RepID=UPI0010AA20B1|nr:glycosyltransferase [Halorhabdus amylolytica]